ncbi:Copper chaperone [Planctomycetales bacterium 10988]|nr:Copper chaperone [Planctomycetales bacterium 10988]
MHLKSMYALAFAVCLMLVGQLTAAEPAWTSITVKEMHCAGCAQKVASRLYTVKGVKEVRVNVEKKTLFVAGQEQATLSPKAMWEAVLKAENEPLRLAGPSGTFTKKPTF